MIFRVEQKAVVWQLWFPIWLYLCLKKLDHAACMLGKGTTSLRPILEEGENGQFIPWLSSWLSNSLYRSFRWVVVRVVVLFSCKPPVSGQRELLMKVQTALCLCMLVAFISNSEDGLFHFLPYCFLWTHTVTWRRRHPTHNRIVVSTNSAHAKGLICSLNGHRYLWSPFKRAGSAMF